VTNIMPKAKTCALRDVLAIGEPATLVSNDEVERRGVAVSSNEAALSRSSTSFLAQRSCNPVIARTDCYAYLCSSCAPLPRKFMS
jgi:hypothetical protein